MIKRIKISNTPPYLCGEQVIEARHINFIFGLNGSGKTTISRYLRNSEHSCYCDCLTEWDGLPIECAVYNRDYVDDNFSESSIPGIFTLGEENIEIQEQIKQYVTSIKELEEQRSELQRQLEGNPTGGLTAELQALETSYADKFWEEKQLLDRTSSPLQLALEGFRGSKEAFKKKLLSEYSVNTSELMEKAELESLCTQLYNAKAEKSASLKIPNFNSLYTLETSQILKKVIVGKADVDISRLIKKLGNDSWFRQGTNYIEQSEGVCPFCQRPLEKDFLDKVAEYFDKTYLEDVQEIDRLYAEYNHVSGAVLSEVISIIENPSSFINLDLLNAAYQELKNTVEGNRRRLLDKKNAPNMVILLDSTEPVSNKVARIIRDANDAIAKYNERIDHIKDERIGLAAKVWKFILNDLSVKILAYLEEKEQLENTISSAREALDSIKKDIEHKSRQLRSLEQRLTSVIPTANGINELLKNYGVTAFSLKVDESQRKYQFIRDDGTPAFDSLSEGERNFVTFLYFMYSLQGNTDESGHNDNKVVVIDDPVSSLDNDVLFLVSSLIRDQFKRIYAGEGTIKQLFILSHNIFFFKEVSYKQGIDKKKTGYWMISKSNNHSKIKEYEKNPVSSTYEMLWDEIRKAQANPTKSSTISLANTMRRIIEHYFSLLGGEDLSKYHLKFPDGERQVFKSLISWANAGSHSAFDDYSATPNMFNAETYLKVFKELFEHSGHIAHYNMMMKSTAEENKNEQDEV